MQLLKVPVQAKLRTLAEINGLIACCGALLENAPDKVPPRASKARPTHLSKAINSTSDLKFIALCFGRIWSI